MSSKKGWNSRVLTGHIDTLTTTDFVEGWAFDPSYGIPALEVEVRDSEGQRVAHGFAHLFRGDLADVEYGLGWCAFRLRLDRRAPGLRQRRLELRALPGGELLHAADNWPLREDIDDAYTRVEAAVDEDPTVLRSIDQLRGCQSLFARFVKQRGVNEFVRAAYAYVLGRAADPEGLMAYGRMLRNGSITPFGLLTVLADSSEFQSRSRLLPPPSSPGFVFRC
ncbi:MAG: DUF4214 domain-containing protein [Roseococcus sp.]|nr:DUF4214 domain-containing protein [Roseococcus sp.]